MSRPFYARRDPDPLDLEALLAGDLTARRVDHPTRAAAVRILSEQGVRPGEIADRLQMNLRTVERYRSRLGLTSRRRRSCPHPDTELSTYESGRQRCRACRRDAWHLREASR